MLRYFFFGVIRSTVAMLLKEAHQSIECDCNAQKYFQGMQPALMPMWCKRE
jgi:hypothetical protein